MHTTSSEDREAVEMRAKWLLDVSDGKADVFGTGTVEIPIHYLAKTEQELTAFSYPDIRQAMALIHEPVAYFGSRAILAPLMRTSTS